MWSLWIIAMGLTVVAGLLVRGYINNDKSTNLQVDRKELLLGMFVIGPLIVLMVTGVGWKAAFAETISFDEFYNGWEQEAIPVDDNCTRDGSCHYVYACDAYWDTEYYQDCDSEGKNCTTKSRQVLKHHSCPFFQVETDYIVKDTLKQTFTIGQNCVDPGLTRWTGSTDWTSNSPGTPACVGIPPFWQAAHDRIASGNPGYTSGRFSYDNLILASQQTILREYSTQIEYYRSQGLLPDPTYQLHTWYWSDKVHIIGCEGLDPAAWQHALGYLNAALGTELQGDLHMVISCDPRINLDPDTYLISLKADGQNPEIHGDNVLSKNTIIAVIGSDDGQTVSYGRATTGMPIGNGGLEIGVMSYFGNGTIPLTPEAVIGKVHGEFYIRESDGKLKVRGLHDQGIGGMQDVVFGLSDPSTIFTRVSMRAEDADDVGTGFSYLASEIRPSTGAQVWIVIFAFIATCGMWYVFAQVGPSKRRMRREFDSYYTYG